MKTRSTIKIGFLAALAMSLFFVSPQEALAQTNEKIYEEVDKLPVYPGGMEGLVDFMVNNIKYPKTAKEANVQGTVMVTFVVQKDGTVTQGEILRGIGAGCDEEALRIVDKMDAWSPGIKDGEKVNTRLTLPIKFAL